MTGGGCSRQMPQGGRRRACGGQAPNPWGYPAKDRAGRLGMLEPPDLGRLIDKIHQPLPLDARPLVIDPPAIPAPSATPQPDPTN